MPVPWLAVFKAVPWIKVIGAAPTLVDAGRKLWDRLPRKEPAAPQPPDAAPEGAGGLESRVAALEKSVAQLRDEAVSTTEVVHALTEQNAQLVSAVGVLLARTRVLAWACAALGAAALVAALTLAL